MSSLIPSSSGVLTIPVLNVNFLYIQGNPLVDFSGSIVYLQQEIDQLDNEVNALQAIVNRIDLTGLTGNLVITDANKNSVLLTAIQNLQGQVGNINQFDLTALAPYPPAHITITPTTTNQALDIKITDISNSVFSLNTKVTDLSNNVSSLNTKVTDLSNNVTTINGQIVTLQNQVTSINNSITAINAKLINFQVYTAGSASMNGFRNNTGFACDLGGNDTGNGLFVYPNGDNHNAQVRIETENGRQLYMRGGSAVTLYGGSDGQIGSRNAIFIGDKTDNVKIGSFSGAIDYPLIDIGTSGSGFVSSRTNLKGDVYFTATPTVSIYDQLISASGSALTVGKLSSTTSPFLSGLTVTTVSSPLVSITQLFGAITLTTGAGLISLITGVGGINMTCGGGAVTINTGGGAMSLACGAGVLNMASGTGTSNWTTANGDIYLGAGKGTGGTAGGITMASIGNIVIQPDASLNIYHTDFMEMNTYPTAPATTTRRIYDISGDLYYNGVNLSVGDASGNIYVLKTGSTMTGTLVVPKVTTPLIDSSGNFLIDPSGGTAGYNKTSYVEMVNNATAPATVSRRIYDISGNLYYNGTILSNTPDPSGIYVLKTGDTMTGNLNVPTIQTTQIGSFVTDLSLNSSLNLIVTPTLEGRYNRTGYIEFVDNSGAPAITTNRLYQQSNQLFFDGTALAGGGSGYLPLTGGTLTGAVSSVYDAGQATPQFQLTNTNNSAPIGGQGATIALRNDSAGNGAVGDRCGQMTFLAKDSVGTGARNFASIQGFVNDPTSTSIDGRLSTFVANNNTSTEIMRLVSETGTNARRCNIASNYMEIGSGSIASTATSTLTVAGSGTANITTSLQTPLIYNALNIYPATSSTQVDNAVRKYQPERLYKLLTYPEPLSAPTIDGEKVYFVNPTGVPSSALDSFVTYQQFGNQGGATFQYLQKTCFYYGSSVSGGVDAYYFACKYSDGNSYVFCYLDIAGTAWKMYPVGRASGEINDMCVGNPNYGGGGINHRVYVGGDFVNLYNSASPSTPVLVYNVGAFYISVSATSGFNSSSASPLLSAKDPALGHETAFDNVAGVAGTVNCIWNAVGLGAWGTPSGADIIVIGGNFYGVGGGGGTPPRFLASIAWWNPEYTSGLQTDQIGWSTLNNNALSGTSVTGVGTPSFPQTIRGIGFFDSGWGVMVYTGTTYINEIGSPVNSNYMAIFYKASGSVSFGTINSDDMLLETGQTFPNEGAYNYTNVIKGGKGASPSGTYGDFNYYTLCITNGLTPTGGQGNGVSYRPSSLDPYELVMALVIDDLVIVPARQPKLENNNRFIVGFYCNQAVYPDKYFLTQFETGLYQSYTSTAPFVSYSSPLTYNGATAYIRGFASYSTLTGYTGLNCWGQQATDGTLNWFYKTTGAGDLVIELSGCLVRTAPNVYGKDTITFLGNNDGSSLCLIGDTNTTTNPFGLPSWWAFSQDGSIKYDDETVVSGGGIQTLSSGTGISAVNTGGGNYQITNVGVTSIVAGTNVTISPLGGTGAVTINATGGGSGAVGGYLKVGMNGIGDQNYTDDTYHLSSWDANFLSSGYWWGGIAVSNFITPAGGVAGLQYIGDPVIAVNMTLNLIVKPVYTSGGTPVNLLSNVVSGYTFSSFGINVNITDGSSIARPDQLNINSMVCGAGSVWSVASGVSNNYQGTVVCNFILRKNDIIKTSFITNPVFNQSANQPANTFIASVGSYVDGSYMVLTCVELTNAI